MGGNARIPTGPDSSDETATAAQPESLSDAVQGIVSQIRHVETLHAQLLSVRTQLASARIELLQKFRDTWTYHLKVDGLTNSHRDNTAKCLQWRKLSAMVAQHDADTRVHQHQNRVVKVSLERGHDFCLMVKHCVYNLSAVEFTQRINLAMHNRCCAISWKKLRAVMEGGLCACGTTGPTCREEEGSGAPDKQESGAGEAEDDDEVAEIEARDEEMAGSDQAEKTDEGGEEVSSPAI